MGQPPEDAGDCKHGATGRSRNPTSATIDAVEFADRLPDRLGACDRPVIRLIEFEGQTPAEVASTIGWRPTQVGLTAQVSAQCGS